MLDYGKTILLLAVISLFAIPSFAASGTSVSYESGDETAQGMLYSYAGHAFENPNNNAGYRADDAAEA